MRRFFTSREPRGYDDDSRVADPTSMTESDREKPHHIKAGIEPCNRDYTNWKQESEGFTNSATGPPMLELNFGVFPRHKRKYNSE